MGAGAVMIEKHSVALRLDSDGDSINLVVGPGMRTFATQLKAQGQVIRAFWRGLVAIESKCIRVWNAVAAGRMNEAKERRRREAIADELMDLFACSYVHLYFAYPDDMPLDGTCQLVWNESKKKKPRKSGAKRGSR
jgi:hypothetical protein